MFRGFSLRRWVFSGLLITAIGVLVAFTARHAAGASSYMALQDAPSQPQAITQPLPVADTASWPIATGRVDGVTYTFRYPPTWNADLLYCAPSMGVNKDGGHVPAGCASTDVLVGKKALDVGLLPGSAFTVNGKAARKQIESASPNVLVSQIYTSMVYDAAGAPLFGFTTQIGAGTSKATRDAITADLDAMAGTIQVEAQR